MQVEEWIGLNRFLFVLVLVWSSSFGFGNCFGFGLFGFDCWFWFWVLVYLVHFLPCSPFSRHSKQLTPLKVLPPRLVQMWALPLRFFAEKWNHFSVVLLLYITQRVVGMNAEDFVLCFWLLVLSVDLFRGFFFF
jgi:hypothetical protein